MQNGTGGHVGASLAAANSLRGARKGGGALFGVIFGGHRASGMCRTEIGLALTQHGRALGTAQTGALGGFARRRTNVLRRSAPERAGLELRSLVEKSLLT